MKKSIYRLPKETVGLLKRIGALADSMGINAYIVGGIVRDIVMERVSFDIDIVVEGDAGAFARRAGQELRGRTVEYRQFATATVYCRDGRKIDFATARKESYPYPAALPVVSPGTIKDDIMRRDFSVNALALCINKKAFGRLVDYTGGMRDIVQKRMRILHTQSFIDDPTRIVRAIRFAVRFGFVFDSTTRALMRQAIKRGMLRQVKPPRLWRELHLLFKEPDPKKCIVALARYDLQCIHPRLKLIRATKKILGVLERSVAWCAARLAEGRTFEAWLPYFIALIGHLSRREINWIIGRFCLTRAERKGILSYAALDKKELFKALKKTNVRPSEVFKRLKPLSLEAIALLHAQATTPVIKTRLGDFLAQYDRVRVYVTGNELKSLGVKPGKQFGTVLTKILHGRLDGKLRTKEDELAFIRRLKNA